MNRLVRIAIAFALATLCLCSGARAKVAIIQIPGAQGVMPVGINDKGQVTGFYYDASGYHGFLWQHRALATFDVSGAQNTQPVAISATGVITGRYNDKDSDGGFVRAADGAVTTFNVRHGRVTIPYGANRRGWSVGTYYPRPQRPAYQAFLRRPSGKTKEFSVPGATGGAIALVVNLARTVAGEALIQGTYKSQGFVRSADGTATVFGDPDVYTNVAGINDTGTIAGSYLGEQAEGFIRTSDGAITTFVAPNGANGTYASAINNAGTIAGTYADSSNTAHGFLRATDGTVTSFDPHDSVSTQIYAINNKGAIAGTYTNKGGLRLGFAGKP